MKRTLATLAGAIAVAAFLACGGFGADNPQAPPTVDGALPEASNETGSTEADTSAPVLDAGAPDGRCSSDMPFLTLTQPPGINTAAGNEYGPRLTTDERTLFIGRLFSTNNMESFHRATPTEPWSSGFLIGDPGYEFTMPWISPDGTRLYYARMPHDTGLTSLARVDVVDGGVNNSAGLTGIDQGSFSNHDPYLSLDESELWFASQRGDTGFDIMHAVRNAGIDFANVTVAVGVNSATAERMPVISADGLTLYFATDSGRGAKEFAIRMARRPTRSDPFEPSIVPPGIESLQTGSLIALPSWISPDNCRLYVTTTLNGPYDAYIASRR